MVRWFGGVPITKVLDQLTDWIQVNARRCLLGFKMYEANHIPLIDNLI